MFLTPKETEMLTAFIAAGADCNGATCADDLLQDNMTWCSAKDLKDALGWDSQTVGGVMSALDAKGLIVDSGEGVNGQGPNQWFASDEGITLGWPLYAAT